MTCSPAAGRLAWAMAIGAHRRRAADASAALVMQSHEVSAVLSYYFRAYTPRLTLLNCLSLDKVWHTIVLKIFDLLL